MANLKFTGMVEADALSGVEIVALAQPSADTKIVASTISAVASGNHILDSGNGFVAAGFAVGDRISIVGFTGNVANNHSVATIMTVAAGDMTVDETMVNDSAGESVTIAKWVTKRTTATLLAELAPSQRDPRIQTVTSSATVTPTFLNDAVKITAQAAALALANPTGTPVSMMGMVIRIKDNGTSRAISYDTQYRAIGVTLPTATVISKTLYLAMIYNSDDTKWDVVAVGQEA